jgi:hypothetical protein
MTGFSPNASPFCAPETAKSASPAAVLCIENAVRDLEPRLKVFN